MGKLSKVNHGRRERGKRTDQERRRGGVFIPPPIKIAVIAFQAKLSGPGDGISASLTD
jgi:hypothetical protein